MFVVLFPHSSSQLNFGHLNPWASITFVEEREGDWCIFPHHRIKLRASSFWNSRFYLHKTWIQSRETWSRPTELFCHDFIGSTWSFLLPCFSSSALKFESTIYVKLVTETTPWSHTFPRWLEFLYTWNLYFLEIGMKVVSYPVQIDKLLNIHYSDNKVKLWEDDSSLVSVKTVGYIILFTPKPKRYILPTFYKRNMSEVVRIGSIFHHNPFTPKSDQFQISPAASPEI